MTLNSSKWIKAALAAVAVAGLAGCASSGSTDNVIERQFTWFSYLEGGDFRATCETGGNRYRMVYNGVYHEQVRTYDLLADGTLDVRVIGPEDVTTWSVSKLSDVLKPWAGETASRRLNRPERVLLISAMEKDGLFGAPAVGTQLNSVGFFWTVAACHNGRYSFTGISWPSPQWEALGFDDVLFAMEPSDIAVNSPRKVVDDRLYRRRNKPEDNVRFRTAVGENGLMDALSLGQ